MYKTECSVAGARGEYSIKPGRKLIRSLSDFFHVPWPPFIAGNGDLGSGA